MNTAHRWYTATTLGAVALAVAVGTAVPRAARAQASPATPPEMVAAYSALADTILAVKRTENDLVRAILAATYAHGEVQLDRARRAVAAGDAAAARSAVEALAADVGQLATEGDASVAAIRKRLIDGGHHHHSSGEAQGPYDEGFVIVTRAATQQLLGSSRAIGQMAGSPSADALGAEWQKVREVYAGLMKPAE
jgi:hypothetical protein